MNYEELNNIKVNKDSSLNKCASINIISKYDKHLLSFLSILPFGLIILDNNKIKFVNKYFTKITGYSPEELINKKFLKLIHKNQQNLFYKLIADIKDKYTEAIECQLKTKDNKWLWVLAKSEVIRFNSNQNIIICIINLTHQKELEQSLTESEQKWRMMCNAAFEAIAIHEGGIIREANKQFAKLFGYEENEIVGMNVLNFAHPEDKELVKQKISEKDESLYEARGQKKDSSTIYGQLRSKHITYKGKYVRLTVINDITEFKRKEFELIKSEKRYRDLLENAIVGIYQIKTNGELLYVNEALAKMVGYDSAEQILKEKIHSDPQIKNYIKNFADELKKSSTIKTQELNIKTKKGENKDILLSAYIDGDIIYGMFLDISEQKLAAEAVKESEEKYRTLFERVPIGLYRTIPSGRIIDVNPAFVKLFSYKNKEEILKMNSIDFYVNPDDRKKWQEIMHRDGVVKRFESLMKRADGSIIWAQEYTHSVKEKNGTILYYEGSIEDITELKETEEINKKNFEMLRKTLEGTVNALSTTSEKRDPYTAGHQQRVTQLACAIAKEIGLSEKQIDAIRIAGTLHDIGKIYIPAEILIKPGPLNPYEMNLIRAHVQISYDILKMVPFQLPVAQIVLQHHERLNGSGYPEGISGNQIMLEARIIAVADVVEAMASNRPYRSAHGINTALQEIINNTGTLYDPDVVKACINLFNLNKFSFAHLP